MEVSDFKNPKIVKYVQANGRELGRLSPDLGVVAAPGADVHQILRLVVALRNEGCAVVADLSGRSVKAQMKVVNRRGCRYALVLGETELESNVASLRRMADGTTVNISLDLSKVRSAVMEVE